MGRGHKSNNVNSSSPSHPENIGGQVGLDAAEVEPNKKRISHEIQVVPGVSSHPFIEHASWRWDAQVYTGFYDSQPLIESPLLKNREPYLSDGRNTATSISTAEWKKVHSCTTPEVVGT
ncbi:hypothetical protein RUM44_006678 [Polyplax serrata]|uniref:Uncharacterized protein n=1 Tax=Polyplax serrata TaxID=468196 RepID=A0ABR1AKB3_POLSC